MRQIFPFTLFYLSFVFKSSDFLSYVPHLMISISFLQVSYLYECGLRSNKSLSSSQFPPLISKKLNQFQNFTDFTNSSPGKWVRLGSHDSITPRQSELNVAFLLLYCWHLHSRWLVKRLYKCQQHRCVDEKVARRVPEWIYAHAITLEKLYECVYPPWIWTYFNLWKDVIGFWIRGCLESLWGG